MPSVRLAMSASPLNGASAAKEPRLSPNAYNLGRWSAGSADQSWYTASNNARPASRALAWSTRNDAQDGR